MAWYEGLLSIGGWGTTWYELRTTPCMAATARSYPSLLTPAVGSEPSQPAVTAPGPFNPAASLSPKVVKRILELEFVGSNGR